VKDILPELGRWSIQGEQIAVATVLRVQRSAPRPAGARLAVTRSGQMAGSVTGGCVEADVVERSIQVMDTGQAVLVNYGIADEWGFNVGLSCGGAIDVLIEPFIADQTWETLCQAIQRQQPVALVVGLEPERLRSRRLLVLGPAGEHTGSIDPALDGLIATEARKLLLVGGTQVMQLNALVGPNATVFVESFLPPPSLFIVGATYTAVSLCRMAVEVGFQIAVLDARSALATEERFPDAHQVIQAWPDEAFNRFPLDQHSYVVVLTHDPKFDIPALACALRSSARYIGALGSRATHQQRRAKLQDQGFSEDDLARIRSPIGLDIGARSPQELAVSILAEIVEARYSTV
jgi:xanthine dehydrogenase accessory factor